jgi:hypothetical protein
MSTKTKTELCEEFVKALEKAQQLEGQLKELQAQSRSADCAMANARNALKQFVGANQPRILASAFGCSVVVRWTSPSTDPEVEVFGPAGLPTYSYRLPKMEKVA